jgi:hypothetical protein
MVLRGIFGPKGDEVYGTMEKAAQWEASYFVITRYYYADQIN